MMTLISISVLLCQLRYYVHLGLSDHWRVHDKQLGLILYAKNIASLIFEYPSSRIEFRLAFLHMSDEIVHASFHPLFSCRTMDLPHLDNVLLQLGHCITVGLANGSLTVYSTLRHCKSYFLQLHR
jgi:hypothetical protein